MEAHESKCCHLAGGHRTQLMPHFHGQVFPLEGTETTRWKTRSLGAFQFLASATMQKLYSHQEVPVNPPVVISTKSSFLTINSHVAVPCKVLTTNQPEREFQLKHSITLLGEIPPLACSWLISTQLEAKRLLINYCFFQVDFSHTFLWSLVSKTQ